MPNMAPRLRIAPHLIGRKGPLGLELLGWSGSSSLPVPDSPRMSTVQSSDQLEYGTVMLARHDVLRSIELLFARHKAPLVRRSCVGGNAISSHLAGPTNPSPSTAVLYIQKVYYLLRILQIAHFQRELLSFDYT